ncbi:MAG TPA: sigma-54 dependent transcriptional regulator [Candidatus Kapabacteria bacterium]|nr:sigma-54-dependent Fis family transcriptional regulator [Candidatus Kapabacteria bacterium]HOV91514.1 sigma-54 dependent transcriptional regulator [Candidatus Kapabacteria bacterium]
MIESKKDFRLEIAEKLGIIGQSEPLMQAVETVFDVAPTDLTVLITGETGTGKEIFARSIHKLSHRNKGPYLSLNCAAIPETLLEAELFGYEKGAFTGASDRRIGFFESANKGTLFLDEIGDMPLQTQVKVLRFLESREFSRLGSSEVHTVDVRIITATNKNLEKEIQEGRFREDLFYRLNSVRVHLPPLRERKEDIPLLFDYFAKQIAQHYGFEYAGISPDAIEVLKNLTWQGNIRELRNFTEKIITLEKDNFITLPILQKYLPPALPKDSALFTQKEQNLIALPKQDEPKNFESALLLKVLFEIENSLTELKNQNSQLFAKLEKIEEQIINNPQNQYYNLQEIDEEDVNESQNIINIEKNEKKLIEEALKKYKHNRKQAAAALGISLRTLYRKIDQYNISG